MLLAIRIWYSHHFWNAFPCSVAQKDCIMIIDLEISSFFILSIHTTLERNRFEPSFKSGSIRVEYNIYSRQDLDVTLKFPERSEINRLEPVPNSSMQCYQRIHGCKWGADLHAAHIIPRPKALFRNIRFGNEILQEVNSLCSLTNICIYFLSICANGSIN